VRRIQIETRLTNNEKWVRYQALFPANIQNGRYTQEIPFGAVERPSGIEFPAQQWADYSDGQHGFAVLNCGSPGNLVVDGTLLLSLLRAQNVGGYGFGGGYEPGMSSESGFELGQTRSFRYALVPHSGDWRAARLYRAGLELNQPLGVFKTGVHPGRLPSRWGLLDVSGENLVVTSVQPGARGSLSVRLYEASGTPAAKAHMRLKPRVKSAKLVNLMGDTSSALPVKDNGVELAFRPFEIKSIELELEPNSK
jgi:alpha-mannosidase